MNPNYLLDREFFNITTRNNNNYKNEERIVSQEFQKNNIIYMDRDKFTEKKEEKQQYKKTILMTDEDKRNEKINNINFNSYQTQHKLGIKVDRIGYENSQKEQLYYRPFERNIMVENKNLTKLDFIEKDKKSEYYKKIDLKKFNPNINYKDFIN